MPKPSPDLPETFDNQLTPLDELVVEHFPDDDEGYDQLAFIFDLDDHDPSFEDTD